MCILNCSNVLFFVSNLIDIWVDADKFWNEPNFENFWNFVRLSDNNMGSRDQKKDGSHHGEEGEDDETESVQDHGSKLPITLSGIGIIVTPNLLSDHSKLF